MATRFFSYSDAERLVLESKKTEARLLLEAQRPKPDARVFLSHSTKDDPRVPGAVELFKRFDTRVYADDFDSRLPYPPNVHTAAILKGEILKHPRLVVLSTPDSRLSGWIPWELGLADGQKGMPSVALLIMTPEGMIPNWSGRTYYNLYPKIMLVDEEWLVWDPRDEKCWELHNWLYDDIK